MMLDMLLPSQAASVADGLLLSGALLAVLGLLLYLTYRTVLGKTAFTQASAAACAAGLAVCALGLYAGSSLVQTMESAYARGMPADAGYTVGEIKSRIRTTPVQSVLPGDLKGSIIIYYKFGCRDCESVYYDIIRAAGESERCFFVSTQSAQGRSLLESYPVAEVPSAVYVKQNSGVPYVAYKLFLRAEDSDAVGFDRDAWDRLLVLQWEGR